MLRDKQHGRVAIPHLYECYKIEFQGWMECCEHTVIRMPKHENWSLSIPNLLRRLLGGIEWRCVWCDFFFRRFQRKKRLNMPRNLYQLIENSIIFALRFWVIPPMSWQWNGSTRIKFIDPRQLHWWPSEGMPWISNIFSKICHQRWHFLWRMRRCNRFLQRLVMKVWWR